MIDQPYFLFTLEICCHHSQYKQDATMDKPPKWEDRLTTCVWQADQLIYQTLGQILTDSCPNWSL